MTGKETCRNDLRRERGRGIGVFALPLLLCLFGCWPYCQLGGGTSSNSVTVDGEDGLFTRAEASAGGTTARIVFERETRKVTGGHEVTYVFSKKLVTQELRLEINDAPEDATFMLEEHNEASSFDEHRVAVAPDGKRVAYRLDDQPWRFVHLLSADLAVHGPGEQEKLDWGEANTIADDFVEIFNAQNMRLDGLYSFNKHDAMLNWLRAHRGEDEVARALFELAPEEQPGWLDDVKRMTPKGQGRLKELLKRAIETGSAHPVHYSQALQLGAVDSEKLSPAVLRKATDALVGYDYTIKNDGADLAEYLRLLSRHDPKYAAKIGCDLLGEKATLAPNGLPYALGYGRPLHLIAFAVVASDKTACKEVREREDVRCSACGGPCSPATLADVVSGVLDKRIEQPPLGETPEDQEKLARLTAAAQLVSMEDPAECQ